MSDCLKKESSADMTWDGIIQSFSKDMLVAVTELRTKEEIDTFIKELGDRHE